MIIRGKLLYKGEVVEAGIEFENEDGSGRIIRVGKRLKGKNVRGLILPAAIDTHVHFRDFKESNKETIESGSLSAICGGVCLVVDQPNCKPVVEDEKVYFERMKKAEKKLYCDYSLNLALTKNNSNKIGEIAKKVSEKYFLPAVGEVFLEHENENLQIGYEELSSCAKLVKKVTIHAEDPEYIKCRKIPNFLCRDEKAEVEAVKRCLNLMENHLGVHFCHISTEEAVLSIFNSTASCEVTPHHMLLTTKDYDRLKEFVNVNPPLREKRMLEFLNYFDIIASDHAPHTVEDKRSGLPGFPGVETTYPLIVSMIKEGIVGLGIIEMLSLKPAKIFGFDKFGYGDIREGNYANFAIFDFSKECTINSKRLHSLCGWTPYEGFKAVFPAQVYLRGNLVLEEFEVLDAFGKTLSGVTIS